MAKKQPTKIYNLVYDDTKITITSNTPKLQTLSHFFAAAAGYYLKRDKFDEVEHWIGIMQFQLNHHRRLKERQMQRSESNLSVLK